MFKTRAKRSTTPLRVRMTTSVARSHANTTTGPRPIVPRSATAVAAQGPGRSRVASPEQPFELPFTARSHSQGRDARMTDAASSHPAASSVLIGIDVAGDKLDLTRSDARQVLTVANDEQGIAQVVELLRPLKPALIVIEATGGIERRLVDALLDADLPVAVVNPGNVRHLALGLGILAKNDAIDAHVLVEFARHAQPRLAEKRSKNQAELDALVTCRRQLAGARAQQTNRRGATVSRAALRSIDAVIAAFDKQIDSLDRQIRKLIESDDDDFHEADRILRSAPGIGPVASSTLIGELNELGRTDR